MSKPNPKLIEDALKALERSDKPITSVQLHHRLPQYALATLRSMLAYLSTHGMVSSVKGPGGAKVYELVRSVANSRTYEWREYVAPQPTVIPVRSRGRIAPNVSDGPYVGMGGIGNEWRQLS